MFTSCVAATGRGSAGVYLANSAPLVVINSVPCPISESSLESRSFSRCYATRSRVHLASAEYRDEQDHLCHRRANVLAMKLATS